MAGMALAVLIRPCVGFDVVAPLRHHVLGENVLLVKKRLQRTLHLVQRPRTLMQSRNHRQQHIGVMLNFVQIVVILVVAVGTFIGVEIILQLGLQRTIGGLGCPHIPVLGGISAGGNGSNRAIAQRHH